MSLTAKDPDSDDLWSPTCPTVSPVDSATDPPIPSPPTQTDPQISHEQPQRPSTIPRNDTTPRKPTEDKETKHTSPSSSKKCRNRSREPTKSNGRNAEKRAAHNVIEKRYRSNMNAKFLTLQKAISGAQKTQQTPRDGSTSLKKSEILSSAISYMEDLQEENQLLQEEVAVLRQNQNLGPQGWRLEAK